MVSIKFHYDNPGCNGNEIIGDYDDHGRNPDTFQAPDLHHNLAK